MKKRIFVLNGIHGAGKTTLGEMIAKDNPRLLFYQEIGRQLRNEVSYNALESGETFDLEVMKRELERDKLLLREAKIPVVETWHIGNIGYVAARSPHLLDQYTNLLAQQLQKFDPVGIYVDIDWETFKSRITERINPEQVNNLINFYEIISNKIHALYHDFNIPSFVLKNQSTLEEVFLRLKREILPFIEEVRVNNKERRY